MRFGIDLRTVEAKFLLLLLLLVLLIPSPSGADVGAMEEERL